LSLANLALDYSTLVLVHTGGGKDCPTSSSIP